MNISINVYLTVIVCLSILLYWVLLYRAKAARHKEKEHSEAVWREREEMLLNKIFVLEREKSELHTKNKEYEEALHYYADPDNYETFAYNGHIAAEALGDGKYE